MLIRLFLSNNSTFDFVTNKYVTMEGFSEDLVIVQAFGKDGKGFFKFGDFLDFNGMFIRYTDIVAFKEIISD